jgi:hypothetical protein
MIRQLISIVFVAYFTFSNPSKVFLGKNMDDSRGEEGDGASASDYIPELCEPEFR